MANCYTKGSFIIPCTFAQAAMAVDALKQVTDGLSRKAKEALAKAPSVGLSPQERMICELVSLHPDADVCEELTWEFSATPVDEGLWVYHDETLNTDHAATFASTVLRAYCLDEPVVIGAAFTCDKPMLNSFGGTILIVTKDYTRSIDQSGFLNAELDAFENNERYFKCSLLERNGEHQYRNHFLLKLSADEDPEKHLKSMVDGYLRRADSMGYLDGVSAGDPRSQEITPYEFATMKKYLDVL